MMEKKKKVAVLYAGEGSAYRPFWILRIIWKGLYADPSPIVLL
jgi:hypothetical protein